MQASDDDERTASSSSEEESSEEEETASHSGLAGDSPLIEFITDKSLRRLTFKVRKNELIKKSYELSTLTGTQLLVIAVSESGLVHTFTTARLRSLVARIEKKKLIRACLDGDCPPPTQTLNDKSLGNVAWRASPSPQGRESSAESPTQDRTKNVALLDTNEDSAEPVSKPNPNVKLARKGSISEKKYVRSERFWLSDGNIILSVRLDTPTKSSEPRFILYRIHKSALARHSEVFEHMFSASASSAGENAVNETYDGLPVIEMPDSREHVCSLLEVLYEPWSSLPSKHFEPRERNTAKLILEIAAKYEMDAIRRRIVSHIIDYWPHSLSAWDVFEARLRIVEHDEGREDEMDCFAQEPASAIALARRFEIKSILPAAFYDLGRIPASADWNKRQARADDAIDAVDLDTWNTRSAQWLCLSVADYHRICVGHPPRDAMRLPNVETSA
ncbi:hypothetical protein M0805_004572 [Coniferiporia weirii]|nr:hypothetical protein M0805_004572 [Coniferiporia weirii]